GSRQTQGSSSPSPSTSPSAGSSEGMPSGMRTSSIPPSWAVSQRKAAPRRTHGSSSPSPSRSPASGVCSALPKRSTRSAVPWPEVSHRKAPPRRTQVSSIPLPSKSARRGRSPLWPKRRSRCAGSPSRAVSQRKVPPRQTQRSSSPAVVPDHDEAPFGIGGDRRTDLAAVAGDGDLAAERPAHVIESLDEDGREQRGLLLAAVGQDDLPVGHGQGGALLSRRWSAAASRDRGVWCPGGFRRERTGARGARPAANRTRARAPRSGPTHPPPGCGGSGRPASPGLSPVFSLLHPYTPSTLPSSGRSPGLVASVSSVSTLSRSRSQSRASPLAKQRSAWPSPSTSPRRGRSPGCASTAWARSSEPSCVVSQRKVPVERRQTQGSSSPSPSTSPSAGSSESIPRGMLTSGPPPLWAVSQRKALPRRTQGSSSPSPSRSPASGVY